VEQGIQRFRGAGAGDDLHLIGDRHRRATGLSGGKTGAIVRAVDVVFPDAPIQIQDIGGAGDGRRSVGGKRGSHVEDPKHGVLETDEGLQLFVALGRGAADQTDEIGVAHHQVHRPARRHRDQAGDAGSELDVGHRIAALRDQMFDVNFARDRRGRQPGVGIVGIDAIASGVVVGRGIADDLDFEVSVGTTVRRQRRQQHRVLRAGTKADESVGRGPVPGNRYRPVAGRGVGTDAGRPRKPVRSHGNVVAIQPDDVPGNRPNGQRGTGGVGEQTPHQRKQNQYGIAPDRPHCTLESRRHANVHGSLSLGQRGRWSQCGSHAAG